MPGAVARQALAADDELWRRIHADQYVPDGSGGWRVSTAAFKDPEMSVDRAAIRSAAGEDHSMTRQDGAGVAVFTVQTALDVKQACVADPLDDNAAHALVVGNKKQRSVQKHFLANSTFVR